jgi:hypothetical protein
MWTPDERDESGADGRLSGSNPDGPPPNRSWQTAEGTTTQETRDGKFVPRHR